MQPPTPNAILKLSRLFAVFLLLSACSSSKAQLIDTINYSVHQKPKFFATLASFNTIIDKQYASIGGVRMGLYYNQRIRLGVGFFNLTNNAVVSEIQFHDNDLEYTTSSQLYFRFVSLSAEYLFYNKYPWQCSVTPFNLGYGLAKYEYVRRPENKKVFSPSESVFLYQPEVSVQYSLFSWLGFGVSTGARFNLYRSKKQTQHLNAPTFAFVIRLSLDEVYKMLFIDGDAND